MKSFISFVRQINPCLIFGLMFLVTDLYILFNHGNNTDSTILFLVCVGIEIVMLITVFKILNHVTYGNQKLEEGYKAHVAVSIFGGERVRWENNFKTKGMAKFAAIYRAWYLDHFGVVNSEFGINYGVKEITVV
jgi:hypothetical protein